LINFCVTLFAKVSVCSCYGFSPPDFPRQVMKYKTCNLWIMTPLCVKINLLGAHYQANLFSVLGCPLRWDSRQLPFHILLMGVFLGFSVTRPVCRLDFTEGRRSGVQTDSSPNSSGLVVFCPSWRYRALSLLPYLLHPLQLFGHSHLEQCSAVTQRRQLPLCFAAVPT
jgi:hypothetical protein